MPERRDPDRMSEYRERKPTRKGLLARVKCQQRNASTQKVSITHKLALSENRVSLIVDSEKF